MEQNRVKALEAVFRAIDRTNELLSPEDMLHKREDAQILGEGSGLDSMGFVNFIVALEDELQNLVGCSYNLVEELNGPREAVQVDSLASADRSGSLNAGDLATFLARLLARRGSRSESADVAAHH